MRKVICMTVAVLMLAAGASAQDIIFGKTYAGANGKSVRTTSDGGFIISATITGSDWYNHASAIKVDKNGTEVFRTICKADGMNGSEATVVRQTRDGGYLVAGYLFNQAWEEDFYFVKLNGTGEIQWSKYYNRARIDEVYAVEQTPDGGYIAAGKAEQLDGNHHQAFMLRLTAEGDTLWTKELGGQYEDYFNDVKVTRDGGYIFAGRWRENFSGNEAWLLKTDADGKTQWSSVFGGVFNSVDICRDGGYVACADGIKVVKVDSSGAKVWENTYDCDLGKAIVSVSDGGYIAVGTDYIMTGDVHYDMFIVKINAAGEKVWTKTIGETKIFDQAFSVASDGEGALAVYGTTTGKINGVSGGYLNSLSNTYVGVEDGPAPVAFTLEQNVPNPFNPETVITFSLPASLHTTLEVYNLSGQKVATLIDGDLAGGSHSVVWNCTSTNGGRAASGVYLYRLTAGKTSMTRKMLLVR